MPVPPQEVLDHLQRRDENDGFGGVDSGFYVVVLTNVIDKDSKNGDPMWRWVVEVLEDLDASEHPYDFVGDELDTYTIMTKQYDWKVGQIYDAFGYPRNTDTDTMLGKATAKVEVEKVKQTSGEYKGRWTNNILRWYPVDSDASPNNPTRAGSAETGDNSGMDVFDPTTVDSSDTPASDPWSEPDAGTDQNF